MAAVRRSVAIRTFTNASHSFVQRPETDKFNKYKYTGGVDVTKVMRIDEEGQNERAKPKYQNIISR